MKRGGGIDVYVKWARPTRERERERERCVCWDNPWGVKALPFFFFKCGPELQSDF